LLLLIVILIVIVTDRYDYTLLGIAGRPNNIIIVDPTDIVSSLGLFIDLR